MTGIYPFKMGLQRGFGKQPPEGIPLNKTILPQYLKGYGYSTHGLGKVDICNPVCYKIISEYKIWIHIFQWHLGFCSDSYTPLKRGFDSYFGLFVGDDEDGDKSKQAAAATPKKVEDHPDIPP